MSQIPTAAHKHANHAHCVVSAVFADQISVGAWYQWHLQRRSKSMTTAHQHMISHASIVSIASAETTVHCLSCMHMQALYQQHLLERKYTIWHAIMRNTLYLRHLQSKLQSITTVHQYACICKRCMNNTGRNAGTPLGMHAHASSLSAAFVGAVHTSQRGKCLCR